MPRKPPPDVEQDHEAGNDAPSYEVGYGRPPKHTRFQPGQCGNRKGRPKRRGASANDLKATLERTLNKKAKARDGERVREITLGQAGIEQLVMQYARGDRYARRDVFDLADRLGIDLVGAGKKLIEEALSPSNKAILDRYVAHRSRGPSSEMDRVLAPAALADEPLAEDTSEPAPSSTGRGPVASDAPLAIRLMPPGVGKHVYGRR